MNEYASLLMFLSIVIGIVAGFPVAFCLMGTAMLFGLIGFGGPVVSMMIGLSYQVATNYIYAAIPLFVFMGTLLAETRITEDLYHTANLWIGHINGGMAIATIITCVLFAACTGIIGSSVVVIGLIALPAMLELKYDKGLASGVICAGGSLGTIIPPSVVIVMLGPTAGVSVGRLLVGAIFPGLLLAGLYIAQIGIRCAINPSLGAPTLLQKIAFKEKLSQTMRSLVPPVALVFLVMGTIMLGLAAPTEAAALGAFGAIVLSAFYGRLSIKTIKEASLECLRISSMIMFIILAGSLYAGVFMGLGGGQAIGTIFNALNLSPYGYLIVSLFIVFLGGFMLDCFSLLVIFVPLFIPLITALGFNPVWYCILFLVCIQMSYITPPMAPAIFYLIGIAPKGVKTTDIYRGILPFLAMQLIGLGLLVLFPQIILWLPEIFFG